MANGTPLGMRQLRTYSRRRGDESPHRYQQFSLNHPAGEISGTVAGLAQGRSTKICIIAIEIAAAGEGFTPTDDATWQIQPHDTEIDDAIEIEGELHLLPHTCAAIVANQLLFRVVDSGPAGDP
ncbi:MAG: hypothetical protein KDA96_17500 [Planctomycetaceae bacterium]|nr:hypothetical protein [Planctomycetaceae bacterium]